MAWSKIASGNAAFADGNGGHALATGTPSVGDLDVVCVNSDTVVTTPSGFGVAATFVNNQGAYIFYRFATGGEGSSVTITTSGNFNTVATWSRWSGGGALDVTGVSHQDSNGATLTPAFTSSTLSSAGELAIALGALTDAAAVTATAPVWSTGYTPLEAGQIGTDGSPNNVVGFTAYRTDAGTAAESPSVSWSGGNYRNRYLLFASFTAGAEGAGNAGNASATGAALDATVAVGPAAGTASAAGAALDATVGAGPAAGTASAAGAALDAAVSVSVYAECAAGTGSALAPFFAPPVLRGRDPVTTQTAEAVRTIRTSTGGRYDAV